MTALKRTALLVTGSSSSNANANAGAPSKCCDTKRPCLSIFLGNAPLTSIKRLSISLLLLPGKRILPVNSSYTTHAIAHMSSGKPGGYKRDITIQT